MTKDAIINDNIYVFATTPRNNRSYSFLNFLCPHLGEGVFFRTSISCQKCANFFGKLTQNELKPLYIELHKMLYPQCVLKFFGYI